MQIQVRGGILATSLPMFLKSKEHFLLEGQKWTIYCIAKAKMPKGNLIPNSCCMQEQECELLLFTLEYQQFKQLRKSTMLHLPNTGGVGTH